MSTYLKILKVKKLTISKYKLKNFLAERAVANILQAEKSEVFDLIRYDGITGFERTSDKELFKILIKSVPEFQLTECNETDNNHLFISVKKEYMKNEEDIIIDITRIIQTKMLA